MLNLLLPNDAKRIEREYMMRVGAVFCGMFAAAAFIGIVLLGPSYMLTLSKEKVAKETLETLKSRSGLHAGEQEEHSEFLRITRKAVEVLASPRGDSPTELFATVTDLSEDMFLEGLLYTSGEVRELIVLGSAPDRDSLLEFSRRLEKEEEFVSVDLPISNFAKSTDIEFSIRIVLR